MRWNLFNISEREILYFLSNVCFLPPAWVVDKSSLEEVSKYPTSDNVLLPPTQEKKKNTINIPWT